jgi:hypothetical protein
MRFLFRLSFVLVATEVLSFSEDKMNYYKSIAGKNYRPYIGGYGMILKWDI